MQKGAGGRGGGGGGGAFGGGGGGAPGGGGGPAGPRPRPPPAPATRARPHAGFGPGPLFAWRAGAQPWSFSIMMLRMVRSVSTMPGVLMRPMLRMTCSGVAAQMPSLGLTTTPPTAR